MQVVHHQPASMQIVAIAAKRVFVPLSVASHLRRLLLVQYYEYIYLCVHWYSVLLAVLVLQLATVHL